MSGIYIHIPFCHRRCTYCDFFLVTNTKLINDFLKSLLNEIELYSEQFQNENFDTVYFGGGTPSLLTPGQFEQIIIHLKNNLRISPTPEITLEANPEDLVDKNISEFSNAGLNRISLGVQSFIDKELQFLTREHTTAIAEEVIKKVKSEFYNINIDIIYSLPGQSWYDLESSLSKAVSLGAKHISAYNLTFEPDTLLFKSMSEGKVIKNTSDKDSEMFSFIHEFLSQNGFIHYEISNYAKPGFESRHNLKYWSFENYLGLGPSSHSFIKGERWNNVKNISRYNQKLREEILPVENKIVLTEEQKKFEYIMLSLRSKGIYLNDYRIKFSRDFSSEFEKQISELTKKNFAEMNEERFHLNEKGFLIADEIIARYF